MSIYWPTIVFVVLMISGTFLAGFFAGRSWEIEKRIRRDELDA